MTIGIYRLIFPNTNKCYIGQSVNIERRYMQHIRDMEKGLAAKKVQEAFNTYGKPTLDILVDDILCTELDVLEKEAISIFDSVDNGFNTYIDAWQAPSTKCGPDAANSKFTESQIILVFNLLINSDMTYAQISEQTGVTVGVITSIYSGKIHTWLEEKFPQEYLVIRNKARKSSAGTIAGNKLSAISKGITYPKIISPIGEIYTVENAYRFAKEHGLAGNHLTEVLNRHRKSHKGWRIHE